MYGLILDIKRTRIVEKGVSLLAYNVKWSDGEANAVVLYREAWEATTLFNIYTNKRDK